MAELLFVANRLTFCFLSWMSDDMIESLAPALIGKKPNTYTFTKSLAEFLLVEEGGCLPAVIVRPSIIGCTYKDPFPVGCEIRAITNPRG